MKSLDTIAAITTPTGHGGVGIIRISGSNALSIGRRLFRPYPSDPSHPRMTASAISIKPFRLYYGHAIDPDSSLVIDEVLWGHMRAPRSYTREDVVEFQLHGGPMVLHRVLQLILAEGARLADPGEFTRRAFLNGRIDLTQAEAVADIIQAKSEQALSNAAAHIGGALQRTLHPILEQLHLILAEIEAGIEFSEEVGAGLDRDQLRHQLLKQILPPLQGLADSYQHGHMLREGMRLAIVGRPNVGKSSLLNALVQQERAIVTPIPGTTRDIIEACFYIQGLPVVVVDTAGLRPSDDPIERIGIQKARDALTHADLVLFVIEACTPFGPQDRAIWDEIRSREHLIVINKIDLVDEPAVIPVLPGSDPSSSARVCAISGEGLTAVKEFIALRYSLTSNAFAQHTVVTNERHKVCIDQALTALHRITASADFSLPEEMIAMDLQHAIHALQDMLGQRIDEDILDTIFQRFCIGK